MSRYARTYADDYFNTALQDDPVDLMKKFSVCPPSDVEGHLGTKRNDLAVPGTLDSTRTDEVEYRTMGGRKVAWVKLRKTDRGPYYVTGNEGAGTLTMEATYTETDGHIPIYWLPWNAAGAIIRLKIPRKGTRTAGKQDPDIFFTAAINGCSVFVDGAEDEPEVFHCGGDTGTADPDGGADFWRGMLRQAVGRGGVVPFSAEVNKTDYIKEQDTWSTSTGLRRRTTAAAMAYRDWLETERSDVLEIEDVNPWGCVMGVRDGDDWTFYLQQNATVRYTTLVKKKRWGGLKKSKLVREKEQSFLPDGTAIMDRDTGKAVFVDRTRVVSRPLSLSEIFPDREVPNFTHRSIPKVRHR